MDSSRYGDEGRAARRGEYRKVSVGGWIGTILLSGIPVLNLILWIVWAISAKRPSRRTYAQAMLILVAVGAVAGAVIGLVWGQVVSDWALQYYQEIIKATPVPTIG